MGINIKSILLLSFVSLCINTAAEIRNKLNINRGWKFELNEVVGAQHTSFDDNGWMNVNLPHSFSIPYFMWHKVYQGTGWYRKEFDLPTNTKGKTVTLEFEASFIDTEVYVNGVRVGNHVGGYTGFVFDITRYLQKGKNIIAVRVNNEWKPDVAPRAGDHQFSGGIYRDVYLNITDPVHVDWCGTFVTTPHVSATSAICNVKTEIRNNNNKDKNCKVKTEIIDDSGNVIAQTESSAIVKMNACRTYEHSLPEILNPKLWSPETPSLYKARTTVYDGKKVTDVYETTFGIRSIEWSADKGFFLNGSHYYLRGANVHQDQAGWGDAVTNAALRRDVQMMKDAGFNCIRGSHYPHDPAFVQACDEIGMIYFQENVLWGMGGSTGDNGWGTPSSSCYPVNKEHHDHFDNSVLTQLEEMVRIHRNSASIVAWSMCNEPFFTDWETNQPMKELLKKTVRKTHELDQSRGIAIGGSQRSDIDHLDVNGIIPLAFYNGDGASMLSGQNPGVPNLVSEYGSTVTERPGSFQPGWGNILDAPGGNNDPWNPPTWRSGHIIWCGFDHGTVGGRPLATMGIVDYFRIPKRQYFWYVEAYKNGKRNPEEYQWPKAGIPAKLKLEASNTILTAPDGTDDTQLTITVLDKTGQHINNNVEVELSIVSGPGEFPTGRSIRFMPPSNDMQSDISIRDGMAAIAFRSYHAGKTIIKASSPQLQDAIIEITTQGEPVWNANDKNQIVERHYKRYDPTEEIKQASSMISLALNRPVWASSTKQSTDPKHVNNGDLTSTWEAEAGDQEKIWSVFLEDSYCVNQVELTFPDDKAYRYIVQIAKSDGTWQTIIDQSNKPVLDKTFKANCDFGCDITNVRVKFVSECAALSQVRIGGVSVSSCK